MRSLILTVVLVVTLPTVVMAEESTETRSASPASADSAATSGPATAQPAPAAEAEPVAEASPEPALAPVSPDAVRRASFATAIEAREPVDSVETLGNDHDRVFFFTEIVGATGRHLTHRWEYQGEVVAEVPIAVGAPRWRAYSSKTLVEGWLGEWKVSVVDETGQVVHSERFVYEAAPEPEIATSDATSEEAPPAAPASDAAPEGAASASASREATVAP